jgi:hypothetical protein
VSFAVEQDKSFRSLWNEIMEVDAPNNLEIIDDVVTYIMFCKDLLDYEGESLTKDAQDIYCRYFDAVEGFVAEMMDLDI